MVPNRRPYREIARVAESPRRSRGAQNHLTINIYTSNIYHPQHMCIYTYIHVEKEILTWLADSSINHPSISHASLLEIRKAFIEVQLVIRNLGAVLNGFCCKESGSPDVVCNAEITRIRVRGHV